MKLYLATLDDLASITEVYKEWIKDEERMSYTLWSEHYPLMMFEEDIKLKSMYLLKNNDEIISVFVLRHQNDGEPCIKWKSNEPYLYLDRFMVNYKYKGHGLSVQVLTIIETIAKKLGAKQLRLFVADANLPALNLYKKCHYIQEEGMQVRPEDKKIRLLGFDKNLY